MIISKIFSLIRSRLTGVDLLMKGVVVVAFLGLAGCGGGLGDEDSVVHPSPSQVEKVFETGAYCITLSEPNTLGVYGRWALPTGINVWLATASGQKLKQLYSYKDLMNAATGLQFDLVNFAISPDLRASIRKDLTSNVNNKLIVNCEYQDPDTGRSMNLSGMWEIGKLRDHAVIVSPFSDLVARATLAAPGVGRDASAVEKLAINQLTSRFGVVGVSPLPIDEMLYDDYKVGLFVGDGSQVQASMRALFAHAQLFNTYEYEGYASVAASSLMGSCSNKEMCLMYRPGTVTVNTNADFSSGSAGWEAIRNVGSSRVYTLQTSIDGTALAKLTDKGLSEQRLDEIGFQQSVEISGSQLENYGAHFQLNELAAGTTAWIANAYESGVAGAYVCFDAAVNDVLGCYLVGYHFDALQIGNYASSLFKVESTSSFYYDMATQNSTVRFLSLARAAQLIPTVQANLSRIKTVRIGIVATESVNVGRERCLGCYATVRATRVALERSL